MKRKKESSLKPASLAGKFTTWQKEINMAKIIVLNGPAAIGKDTIANEALARNLVDSTHSFKAPMFEIAKVALGAKWDLFMDCYADRTLKEAPAMWLCGMSPRQFMIHLSENFIKPALGNQHFGTLAAEAIGSSGDTIVMSDGGFPDELRALAEYGWGEHEIHIVRLHREGFTFEGDSRNYIHGLDDDYGNVQEHDAYIFDGEIDEAIDTLSLLCDLKESKEL